MSPLDRSQAGHVLASVLLMLLLSQQAVLAFVQRIAEDRRHALESLRQVQRSALDDVLIAQLVQQPIPQTTDERTLWHPLSEGAQRGCWPVTSGIPWPAPQDCAAPGAGPRWMLLPGPVMPARPLAGTDPALLPAKVQTWQLWVVRDPDAPQRAETWQQTVLP